MTFPIYMDIISLVSFPFGEIMPKFTRCGRTGRLLSMILTQEVYHNGYRSYLSAQEALPFQGLRLPQENVHANGRKVLARRRAKGRAKLSY